MKTHTLLAYVALVACATLCFQAALGATPWETYLAVPSPEHARLVTAPSYSSKEPPSTNGPGRLEQDLRVLAEQIRAGDAQAFYLALRFRKASEIDGALAEFVDYTVSDFLRIRPEAFLSGLSTYGTKTCVEATYTDPDIFAERFSAEAYEFTRRLEAIVGVRNSHLVKVRDLCFHSLRSQIEISESHIDSH